MKRNVTLICILSFLILFSSCDPLPEEQSAKIKDDTYTIYEDLRTLGATATSNQVLFDYIIDLAKAEDWEYEQYGEDVLMVKKEGSQAEGNTTALHCNLFPGAKRVSYQSAAILLGALINANNTGDAIALFTRKEELNYPGTEKVPEDALSAQSFIHLTYTKKPKIYLGSAATQLHVFAKDTHWEEPSSGVAYQLSMEGLSGGDSYDRSKKHPNPIIYLGKFLQHCRKQNIHLRIASMDGGEAINRYPESGKVVLVVEEASKKKFLSKFENSEKNFKEKYNNAEDQAQYTLEETTMPQQVLTSEDTTDFLSLLYIIEDGVYAKSKDGENTILSTMSLVNINDTQIVAKTFVRSIVPEGLSDVNNDFIALSQLSDYELISDDPSQLWENKGKTPLSKDFKAILKDNGLTATTTSSFKKTEMPLFLEINPQLNGIALGVNIENGFEFSKSLVLFLEKENQE